MTDAAQLPVLEVAEATEVRPGDTLILRYSRPVAMAQVEQIKADMRELLPDVEVVVVQADGLAVYRPEGG